MGRGERWRHLTSPVTASTAVSQPCEVSSGLASPPRVLLARDELDGVAEAERHAPVHGRREEQARARVERRPVPLDAAKRATTYPSLMATPRFWGRSGVSRGCQS